MRVLVQQTLIVSYFIRVEYGKLRHMAILVSLEPRILLMKMA